MTSDPRSRQVTPAERQLEPDGASCVECPFCHTASPSLTVDALAAGGGWRCVRCGQRWDAVRLDAATAYAAWASSRERPARQAAAPPV